MKKLILIAALLMSTGAQAGKYDQEILNEHLKKYRYACQIGAVEKLCHTLLGAGFRDGTVYNALDATVKSKAITKKMVQGVSHYVRAK